MQKQENLGTSVLLSVLFFFALYIYKQKIRARKKKSSSTVNALVIPYFQYYSPAWHGLILHLFG